ncbi:MAG: PilZ domain-containing protein [Fimbriimonadales bacterium]|nr:PilZ domain-containing protein [Fimbriimonadales bacterium]
MANFEVNVGEEVIVSLVGNDYLASVQGRVVEVQARSLHIALSDPAPFLQSAVMVLIKPLKAPQIVGWSVLEKMIQSSGGTTLKVSYPHWEFLGRARATRFPEQLPVVVRWAPPNSQDTELTGGKTVNISLSGARIRVRKPLPLGSLVHIQLYLRPERVASVIGQVVRAVDPGPVGEGGYEVGVHFVRFLSGYADFVREVAEEPENLDERYLQHSPSRSSQGEEQEVNQGEAA